MPSPTSSSSPHRRGSSHHDDQHQHQHQHLNHRSPIIPHKRGLLPPSTRLSSSTMTTTTSTTRTPPTLNPSAYPAEIQIRRPAFSSLPTSSFLPAFSTASRSAIAATTTGGDDDDDDDGTGRRRRDDQSDIESINNTKTTTTTTTLADANANATTITTNYVFPVFEFDSSQAPQPFLDPEALEKIRVRGARAQNR